MVRRAFLGAMLASVVVFGGATVARAHETTANVMADVPPSLTLSDLIHSQSIKVLMIASILLVILVTTAILVKNPAENVKKALFWLMGAIIIVTTTFLSTATIYINSASLNRGPIHWHADVEFWFCGVQVEVEAPASKLSNKTGSALTHIHNDKRIHIEGPMLNTHDASLGNFFTQIGGRLTDSSIILPSKEGVLQYANGDLCAELPGERTVDVPGVLQVFAFQANGDSYTQEKLVDPAGHTFAPHAAVPPGDCLIVEFGPEKAKTDKLCQSYKLAEVKNKIHASN